MTSVDFNPESSIDEAELRAAVAGANIPSLLPSLFQLTGDPRWFGDEYRPKRPRGFDELNDGGLPEDRQVEIREAAVQAVMAWTAGRGVAVPSPSAEELTTLMSVAVGERVADEYAPMVARHLGFDPPAYDDVASALARGDRSFTVLIIGAGFSGIAAAIALQQAGVPFTIIEKNSEVGGTWWENNYPGARADIPSALYSLSFLRRGWKEHFGQKEELSEYLRDAADQFGLREHIRFEHEVEEARWDEAGQHWDVKAKGPDGATTTHRASAVISAVGLHNRPYVPDFEGMTDFTGTIFHSANWPSDDPVAGKRVAVIGSGATAMQVVTAIADRVDSMTVVQRSAHWIAPNPYYFAAVEDATNWLFEHVPFYRRWYRFRLHWVYAERMYPALPVDPDWDLSQNSVNAFSEASRRAFMAYLTSELEGRDDLVEKCTPLFPPFAKRMLLDNGWFATLKRPNVSLVTDGIERLTPTGLVTKSGEHLEVDTIVLCTGFQQQRLLYPMEVHGVGGRALHEEWNGDDARAYLGMTSPGFPNLFYLYGPNTNPPGGSWVTIAEDQVRYVVDLLATMIRDDHGAVEVRQSVYDAYNERVDEINSKLVIALDGVDSYYRNAKGRVVTNSPWTILEYWSKIREADLDDYVLTPAAVLTP